MLKFFRRIRQKLIQEGKLKNYLIYAIGEILLVVIGILIALQVNNWNEKRNQEQRVRVMLEQIYTSVKEDSELMYNIQQVQQKQIEWMYQIAVHADSFNFHNLLHILFYLDTRPHLFSSETDFLLSSLEFNPTNVKQKELAKQISSYVNSELLDFHLEQGGTKVFITPLLKEADIPEYPSIFGYSALGNFKNVDTTFFNNQDIFAVQSLLKTRKFRNALIASKAVKGATNPVLQNYIEDGHSILKAIRAYYPEVKYRFDDVGILGTAFDSGFEKSIPMTLINPHEGIWEINTYLKTGKVKFRTRDSWNQNWGGNTFPKGRTEMYGADIAVKEGYYNVILNISNNSYEFIKKGK